AISAHYLIQQISLICPLYLLGNALAIGEARFDEVGVRRAADIEVGAGYDSGRYLKDLELQLVGDYGLQAKGADHSPEEVKAGLHHPLPQFEGSGEEGLAKHQREIAGDHEAGIDA